MTGPPRSAPARPGFAARRGYLDLPWVMVVAFFGAVTGDQVVYFFAERHGRKWLVGFRFLYGLRTVLPIAIAWCGIPPRRFVPLNIFGAFLWVIAVGGAGYLFGQAVESVLDRAKKYEVTIVIGILARRFGLPDEALPRALAGESREGEGRPSRGEAPRGE